MDKTLLLFSSACSGNYEGVVSILELGVDSNSQDESGNTALMFASEGGYAEIAELLLESGANSNLKDRDGNTALLYASLGGHIEVVELLLERGVTNPNVQNKDGETPLMLACYERHTDTVKLLLKAGADPSIQNDCGDTAFEFASGKIDIAIPIEKIRRRVV